MPNSESSISVYLRDFIAGGIEPREFTSAFENWWNFHAAKASFDPATRVAIENLFDIAALYTPFEEDRRHYAGYTALVDVIEAAKLASGLLQEHCRNEVRSAEPLFKP